VGFIVGKKMIKGKETCWNCFCWFKGMLAAGIVCHHKRWDMTCNITGLSWIVRLQTKKTDKFEVSGENCFILDRFQIPAMHLPDEIVWFWVM
jgi:hypothetical protein